MIGMGVVCVHIEGVGGEWRAAAGVLDGHLGSNEKRGGRRAKKQIETWRGRETGHIARPNNNSDTAPTATLTQRRSGRARVRIAGRAGKQRDEEEDGGI